jgi:hypothetical protein
LCAGDTGRPSFRTDITIVSITFSLSETVGFHPLIEYVLIFVTIDAWAKLWDLFLCQIDGLRIDRGLNILWSFLSTAANATSVPEAILGRVAERDFELESE